MATSFACSSFLYLYSSFLRGKKSMMSQIKVPVPVAGSSIPTFLSASVFPKCFHYFIQFTCNIIFLVKMRLIKNGVENIGA